MVSHGKRKLIACTHIRGLSRRGKLDNFPWKFESEKAKKIYLEWLAEKKESEKQKAEGSVLPSVAGISNTAEPGEPPAPPEMPDKKAEKEPVESDAGKRKVNIKDALNDGPEDK